MRKDNASSTLEKVDKLAHLKEQAKFSQIKNDDESKSLTSNESLWKIQERAQKNQQVKGTNKSQGNYQVKDTTGAGKPEIDGMTRSG